MNMKSSLYFQYGMEHPKVRRTTLAAFILWMIFARCINFYCEKHAATMPLIGDYLLFFAFFAVFIMFIVSKLFIEGKIKKAAVVLLMNNGKILGVSRKNNSNDFGLPGGKLDKNETFEHAAIRETKEETGLHIFGLNEIFIRYHDGFKAITFSAHYTGDIANYKNSSSPETGVIQWIDFETLKKGTYGDYNARLEQHLINNNFFNQKTL